MADREWLCAMTEKPPTLIDPLVAQLMTASMAETAAVTNMVAEDLQRRVRDREAELDLVRIRIENLLAAPYMPTETVLRNALYPSRDEVGQQVDRRRWDLGPDEFESTQDGAR